MKNPIENDLATMGVEAESSKLLTAADTLSYAFPVAMDRVVQVSLFKQLLEEGQIYLDYNQIRDAIRITKSLMILRSSKNANLSVKLSKDKRKLKISNGGEPLSEERDKARLSHLVEKAYLMIDNKGTYTYEDILMNMQVDGGITLFKHALAFTNPLGNLYKFDDEKQIVVMTDEPM